MTDTDTDTAEEWDPEALPSDMADTLQAFERLYARLMRTLPTNAYSEPAMVALHMAWVQTRLAYTTAQLAARSPKCPTSS